MILYLCRDTWEEREVDPYVSPWRSWGPRCHSDWGHSGLGAAASHRERPDEGGEGRGFAEWLIRVCSGELRSGLSAGRSFWSGPSGYPRSTFLAGFISLDLCQEEELPVAAVDFCLWQGGAIPTWAVLARPGRLWGGEVTEGKRGLF